MKYLSAKNVFLVFLAIIVILVAYGFLTQLVFSDNTWLVEKGDKVKINSQSRIFEKFTAERPNLARISILFAYSAIDNGATLDLKIFDENCSKLIRQDSFFVTSLNSDHTQDFNFTPIVDSKNKTFCLNVSFRPENNKSAVIFLTNNSSGKDVSLNIDQNNLSGQSLSMRPGYKNGSVFADLTELNQRISQYKPWFLKHYWLTGIVTLFIILSLLLVVILILI